MVEVFEEYSSITNRLKYRSIKLWKSLTFSEVSGSLGDLGTFLPLLVGLVKISGLNLGTTLIFTGIYNILTGLIFDIPMPVQPMKTIAAVALTDPAGLSLPQIMAAGLFTSFCVLFLGLIGMMEVAAVIIPSYAIKGMQAGLGINLAIRGFNQIIYKGDSKRDLFEIDGTFMGIIALIFVAMTVFPRDQRPQSESYDEAPYEADGSIFIKEGAVELANDQNIKKDPLGQKLNSTRTFIRRFAKQIMYYIQRIGDAASKACGEEESKVERRQNVETSRVFPSALLLVIVGVIVSLSLRPNGLDLLRFGPSEISVMNISSDDWRTGILKAGLPQLPLTAFNSVISVTKLANDLFPAAIISPGHVATSVGLMNVVGCWFGALPSCHGAGGLAAQVRFGAKYGTAPVFLGLIKVLLGLVLGSSLLEIFLGFPETILGAMLMVSGVELASVVRNVSSRRGMVVIIMAAIVTLAVSNAALGALAGISLAYSWVIRDFLVDLCKQKFQKL